MQNNMELKDKNIFKKSLFYFDKVTSNHSCNWLLTLTWIFVLELISSILEYKYLEIAQNYVYHIPESIFKEVGIALLLVAFIWYVVYVIIFMQKQQFFYLALFASLGFYMIITHDVTFNLLIHNLINPFEFEFNGFGFYMIVQLFIKTIITYLIFKLLVSIKNRNNKK